MIIDRKKKTQNKINRSLAIQSDTYKKETG